MGNVDDEERRHVWVVGLDLRGRLYIESDGKLKKKK